MTEKEIKQILEINLNDEVILLLKDHYFFSINEINQNLDLLRNIQKHLNLKVLILIFHEEAIKDEFPKEYLLQNLEKELRKIR